MIQRFPFRVSTAALIVAGVHGKGTLLVCAVDALSIAIFWKFA